MAYSPTNAGWGAAATAVKKKPPAGTSKPTGSFDPSGSLGGYSPADLARMSPDQLAQVQFALGMSGPPAPDFGALQSAALRSAQSSAQPRIDYLNQERDRLAANKKLSSDAAANFAAAFGQILGGGNPNPDDPAAQQYSLEHFGGSYLGGIAARMGQQLISQQQSYFTETDMKLASQLADVMDAIPGEADKIYQDLVSQTEDILTAPYKNQIAAIAALIKNKRDAASAANGGSDHPYTKNFSDGTTRQWNPKTGKWDIVTTKADATSSYPTYTKDAAGNLTMWNPQTRTWEIANPAGWTLKPAKTAAGKKVTWKTDKAGRPYTIQNGKIVLLPVPPGFTTEQPGTTGGTSNGKAPSPSTVSNTVKRATAAGETALGKVTDNIWARTGNPPPEIKDANGNKIPNPAYVKANAWYQSFLDSGKPFQSAMTRVIKAIYPHLKALGYSQSEIKRAAYDIVSAELDPPKGYKVPKASAARVAANTLPAPAAIDFNWLASATTGKTGWSDLGGPSAHYSKHDSGENWQSNNAWDIGMPVGTPVYATTDGVIGSDVGVQPTRPNDGQRLTLNGQGNSFWYGHLSKIAVRPGQRVKAGQLLGYSGASQNGAAHLHIAVMNLGGNYS